jgi:PAP2 superfamily protein
MAVEAPTSAEPRLRPGFVDAVDRLVARVDGAEASQTAAGARVRKGIALLVGCYAVAYVVQGALHGSLVSPVGLIMLMIAFALYTNRGGRFMRDWVPVLVGLVAYAVTMAAVPSFGLQVHYLPQIDADRVLGFGTLPTTWLQEQLYNGHTGPLEVFSVAMYVSHFIAPLVLAFAIWAFWQNRGFSDLLFGLLAVSILANITFLLAPTAPPWLASEHGLIPDVQPIIKNALIDLDLNALALHKGDASRYNVVAAVPSLHVAWPVVCLLVIRKHRLPMPLFAAQAALTLGVVFAIVYTGEHYLVDAILGAVYALAAWWLLQWAVGARRRARPPVAVEPS